MRANQRNWLLSGSKSDASISFHPDIMRALQPIS